MHILTHGFDIKRFREILEQTTSIILTKEQIKEITDVKRDNPTLLYFDDKSQPSDLIIGLQKYLDETSPEQLKKDWEELEPYNQEGPEMIDSLELSMLQNIAENQKDCPSEIMEAVHKNFWDLVDTKEPKYVSRGYLTDWYQQSIDETNPPIWTDEHLDELYNDFYLIPKK